MNSGNSFKINEIPRSRLATFDVCAISDNRNYISAMLEFDVTETRRKIRQMRRDGERVSFNAYLIKVIGTAVERHKEVSAFRYSKRRLMVFNDVNISTVVEKSVNGTKVPIPVVIEQVTFKTAAQITTEIEEARNKVISGKDVVIGRDTKWFENIYFSLPGFIRRTIMKTMLRFPKSTFRRMGNVMVSYPGMVGSINGWFIHKSIHPLSFGIGSVIKKPIVIDEQVQIREILNMTVLLDHDVIDGAPMARLIKEINRLLLHN